jgi:F0F1-type ATP synthase assembly protein I
MSKKNDIYYYLSLLSQLGLTIIFSILICIFIYKVLAKFIGENIFLFIFFIILGVVGGFYNVYRLIMKKN